MSKKNKERTADAACRNAITLDKCINQINLAVVKLNRLERAGDDLRVRRISTSIANGLENGLKRVVSDEQRRSLVGTFGSAVLRLHEAVGAKEERWILSHVKSRGYTQPLTHDAKYKGHWDGVRGSWDDPKFDKAKGLARLKNRMPPIDPYLHTIDSERYVKTSLIALTEEIEIVHGLESSVALKRIPALLKESSCFYCRFNSLFGNDAVQATIVYLVALEEIVYQCGRIDVMSCGLPCYRVLGGLYYEEIFWFAMPDLPPQDDHKALASFVDDCEEEVRKRTKELCKAELWLYVPWVCSLATCLESVISKAMEIDRSNLVRMYKLMAWTFGQLAMALRKEDPYKFRPHWLTLPIDSYSNYSLGETLDTMQRTTRYAVHTNWDRAITVIPRKFRQCTYEFCLSMNFEVCMIPQLIEEYARMLEQFEARARSLSEDIHATVRRP